VLTVVTGVPEVEKYAYQEKIFSAMQKKLDNAGGESISLVR
jgi:hypothetical protein